VAAHEAQLRFWLELKENTRGGGHQATSLRRWVAPLVAAMMPTALRLKEAVLAVAVGLPSLSFRKAELLKPEFVASSLLATGPPQRS